MLRRSAIMDRNTDNFGWIGRVCMARSQPWLPRCDRQAITSSGNWIAASGVSASQESRGQQAPYLGWQLYGPGRTGAGQTGGPAGGVGTVWYGVGVVEVASDFSHLFSSQVRNAALWLA